MSSKVTFLTQSSGDGLALGVGIGLLLLIGLCILLGLALFALWVWMLVDCAQSPEESCGNRRVAWILILVFTHWLGALLYFFIVRQPRIAAQRAAISAATSPPFPRR